MRGLTDEERAALVPGSRELVPPGVIDRLVARGLLRFAWSYPAEQLGPGVPWRHHYEPTLLASVALRLDAAARELTRVAS